MGSTPQGGFFLQSMAGKEGDFEVIVPWEGGGLAHYRRLNDVRDLPWVGPVIFGQETYVGACLLQTDWQSSEGRQFNFEAQAVTEHGVLHEFSRDNGPAFRWSLPAVPLHDGWQGNPSLIQGNPKQAGYSQSYPEHPPFRMIAARSTGGFQYWERIHSPVEAPKWTRIGEVAAGSFHGASIALSTIRSGDSFHRNDLAWAYQGDVVAVMVDQANVISFFNHRAQSSWDTPDFLGPYVLGGAFWQPWHVAGADAHARSGAPVTALLSRPGHIDVFTTRADGAVMTSWWEQDPGWQPWFEVDPGVRAQPGAPVAALAPREGHIDLFATRADGVVMTTWWESHGNWRPWQGLHPETRMAPGAPVTALLSRPGHIDVFTTRADGAVMTSWWDSNGILAGQVPLFNGRPSMLQSSYNESWGSWPWSNNHYGNFELVAPVKGGGIAHFWKDNGKHSRVVELWDGWNGPTLFGADHLYDDVAMIETGHTLAVVARLTGRGGFDFYLREDLQWQEPIHVSATLPRLRSNPGATIAALLPFEGHIDVYTTSDRATVIGTFFDSAAGWRGWGEVRAEFSVLPGAPVAALAPREGHIDLFATRADGVVMTTWWESHGNWRPWQGLHPETRMAPGAPVTALLSRPGHIDVFTTRADGAVMTSWWEQDPGWQPWFEFP
jgi:hypothetical protein